MWTPWEVLMPLGFFVSAAWTVKIIVDAIRRLRHVRLATEVHSRLLERIGSTKELGEFLNSDGGLRFIDALTVEREGRPQTRIVQALQIGVVLTALGVGLLLLTGLRRFSAEAVDGLVVLSTVALSLGIGLMLSAAAAFVASKRLRLLDPPAHEPGSESSAAR